MWNFNLNQYRCQDTCRVLEIVLYKNHLWGFDLLRQLQGFQFRKYEIDSIHLLLSMLMINAVDSWAEKK